MFSDESLEAWGPGDLGGQRILPSRSIQHEYVWFKKFLTSLGASPCWKVILLIVAKGTFSNNEGNSSPLETQWWTNFKVDFLENRASDKKNIIPNFFFIFLTQNHCLHGRTTNSDPPCIYVQSTVRRSRNTCAYFICPTLSSLYRIWIINYHVTSTFRGDYSYSSPVFEIMPDDHFYSFMLLHAASLSYRIRVCSLSSLFKASLLFKAKYDGGRLISKWYKFVWILLSLVCYCAHNWETQYGF